MKNEKSVMNKINYKLQKNIGDNVKSDALVLGLFKDNKFDFSEVDSITNSIISEMISSKDLSSENGKIEIIHTPKKYLKVVISLKYLLLVWEILKVLIIILLDQHLQI